MILTSIILIILIGCWVNGSNRGLLATLISTGTYIVSWLVAKLGAHLLGSLFVNLLPRLSPEMAQNSITTTLLDTVNPTAFFYNGIAFMLIFSVISFLGHWLLKRLNWLNKLPVVGTVNRVGGGILDVLFGYLIIFIFLMIFQLFPGQWWQEQLSQSGIAQLIIKDTPGMAQMVLNWLA